MKQEIKERVERIRKGEVPDGYKETKVGIIPEDWNVEKLSNISTIFRGASPRPIADEKWFDENSDIGWVRISDISGGEKYLLKTQQHLSDLGIKKSRFVEKNNIIMSICATVGKPKLTGIDVCIHDGFVVFEKPNVNKYFLFYFLENIKDSWQKYGQTGSQMNLNTTIVGDELICTPLKSIEQEKITGILSAWDTAIELKEKLIEVKKEFKRGLMQKFLFKRVTNDILWDYVPLRKCLVPTSYPVNKPSEPYYALGIRSHCKGTFVRHVEDPNEIAMDTLYEVKKNELIINITFAWEGAITLLNKKDEGKLVSHRFPTYKFNEEYTIPDYFKHLVKTKWFVFQLGLLSPGGAGRNRVFNKTDFLKLTILLPSVEEQKKIADFLNSIDNEIDLLNKELNQLKEQKRGLMQLLLTGIVRVEVD